MNLGWFKTWGLVFLHNFKKMPCEATFNHKSKGGLPGRYEPFRREGVALGSLPTRFMKDLDLKKILEHEDLRIIVGLAATLGVDAFLVGGYLRDSLLGRKSNDLDFALSGAWEKLPRKFAALISGRFFWLDEKRQQSRVVKKRGREILVFDFAPLRGGGITDDLRLRDFTINALAMPLFGTCREIIDPLAGRGDLHQGLIRACRVTAFFDDPLRLLRAIRFAAELFFTIEDNTWKTLCEKKALLKTVAGERVRDELFRTLAASRFGDSLKQLCESGLWAEILLVQETRGCYKCIPCAEEAERLCMEFGRLFPECGGRQEDYFNREVEAGISVRSLIKLATVLYGSDIGESTSIAERLKLGRKARRVLDIFCRDEKEVYGILENCTTDRVMYRFFRDREPAGLGKLIIARAAGAVSAASFSRLGGYWLQKYDAEDAGLFLTGGEIMAALGVPPGQVVGEAALRLRDAEGSGFVASREEAREFIKNLLTREPPMR